MGEELLVKYVSTILTPVTMPKPVTENKPASLHAPKPERFLAGSTIECKVTLQHNQGYYMQLENLTRLSFGDVSKFCSDAWCGQTPRRMLP
jgi:hypothetical protein